ncbi:protein unc-13 homolog 4B-like [Sabethes cyaneus]|uniref:protein unc-13 homolog 4B-like n=1 Tax=Sabethes cyaneus TaxID=53552 RepID=UPI00237E1FCE|nr:protein unc-13 homolog 4B-like [Sabethes cyaneus]
MILLRMSQGNFGNYLDKKMEAMRVRWNKTKPTTSNRYLAKEPFFEKFGTLFKERSSQFLLQSKQQVAPLDDTTETQELIVTSKTRSAINPSSGTEIAANQDVPTTGAENAMPNDSDSIEDLYEKVLLEIINGNFNAQEVSEKTLFAYAQDVFKINDKAHEEILKRARFKPTSEVYLRAEIIEAKLAEHPSQSKNINPFVVMYLQNDPHEIVRSSIQKTTTNPVWKEIFSLPAIEKSKETLILEVYNHESNMKKFTKTARICRKYSLSCINTRSSYHKLIGRASIPIESITSSGLVMWYTLSKKRRPEPQGTIKLKFHFSSAQNKDMAAKEHGILTRMFLEYELRNSSVARYWWSGKFTVAGEAILKQHALCADLSEIQKTLIYWNSYSSVHISYPIAFSLFESLLGKICIFIRSNNVKEDSLKMFWNGVKKMLPSCFAVIMKLRKRIAGDKDIVKTVISVLNILSMVDSIRETCDIDLFSVEDYEDFKGRIQQNPNITTHDVTLLAVQKGAKIWFQDAVANMAISTLSDEEKLRNAIQLIQLLQGDIMRASTYYNEPFRSIMNISYTRELCKQHEKNVVVHLKPIVEKICKGFRKLTIRIDQYNRVGEMDALDMSTTVFELYIIMKLFFKETDVEVKGAHNSDIVNYHKWFSGGIAHWCEVFALKTLARLSQAIDDDLLVPEEGLDPKQSSSAAEFLNIIQQIKTFWQQLDWPDQQELNRFLKKSIGDICSCCVYYADRISTKLKPPGDKARMDLAATIDLISKCALVNSNLSILIEVLNNLPADFGYSLKHMDEIDPQDYMLPVKGLSSWKTKLLILMVNHCMLEIKSSMGESLTKFNQIKTNIDCYAQQTSKLIRENLNCDDLKFVQHKLWCAITTEFNDVIRATIEKKSSISSFANLKDFYRIIAQAYLSDIQDLQEDSVLSEKLYLIEKQLDLYSSSTRDLIHRYYIACLEAQNHLDEPERGILTIRCCIRDSVLEIQIIAVENIKLPLDFKGSCDSYVKINLVPGYKFSNIQMPKTRTKLKNHSPTFNEKFSLKLTREQCQITDALIVFNVKVSELLGLSQRYVGECFIRVDCIPVVGPDSENGNIDVQQLFLTVPENIESDSIPVLEYRQSDKEAIQFFRKLKQKLGKAAYTGSVNSIF